MAGERGQRSLAPERIIFRAIARDDDARLWNFSDKLASGRQQHIDALLVAQAAKAGNREIVRGAAERTPHLAPFFWVGRDCGRLDGIRNDTDRPTSASHPQYVCDRLGDRANMVGLTHKMLIGAIVEARPPAIPGVAMRKCDPRPACATADHHGSKVRLERMGLDQINAMLSRASLNIGKKFPVQT